jgi:hypothetical protein
MWNNDLLPWFVLGWFAFSISVVVVEGSLLDVASCAISSLPCFFLEIVGRVLRVMVTALNLVPLLNLQVPRVACPATLLAHVPCECAAVFTNVTQCTTTTPPLT